MTTQSNLLPGVGVDTLVFGMAEGQLEALLGAPSLVEEFDEPETGHSRVHHYFEKGLVLYFDAEDDFRLGCLEMDALAFSLWGKPVARISKEDLKGYLAEKGTWEIVEAIDDHQDALEVDALSATFYFEHGVLISIQLGVLVDGGDQPLWPGEGAA